MPAAVVMVQGTASSAGKSLMVTALCRIFKRRGYRVAPFKSQNMSLNAAVTQDGLEIGRATAVQAEASGEEPTVDMNPILLKPEGESRSQVVLMGKATGSQPASLYHRRQPELRQLIRDCLGRLREIYDVVVIEGAGSPAEVNLRESDIVNMFVARVADAPVLLVGDIDRGGVFASLVGTLALLLPEDRARVKGLIINKFRGDLSLLTGGVDFLEDYCNLPVLGVVPYVPNLRIADEDSVSLESRPQSVKPGSSDLHIAVIRTPRISNHDDFSALEHEEGVALTYAQSPEQIDGADLVILPGSKGTVSDLRWLRQRGFVEPLLQRARQGAPILGICGGCQMLGQRIEDPHGVESEHGSIAALALLPIWTRFAQEKTTSRVRARSLRDSFLSQKNLSISGYEIHSGEMFLVGTDGGSFAIESRSQRACDVVDGAIAAGSNIIGTMIHGLFENKGLRHHLIQSLHSRRGTQNQSVRQDVASSFSEYDRLASAVEAALDMDSLLSMMGLE